MDVIELRVFGNIDLSTGVGGDADALLAQPKRFALLCYLAIPKPGTMVRRDTLLGVFWPDRDAEHARVALRQALRFLRKTLGQDIILRRGSEEVGINPGLLWSDVGAFEAELDSGNWANATDLYNGELLKGFFLSKSLEFDYWLDAERARLAGQYARALEELAKTATAEGKTRKAVETWQRLVRHDPFDSRLVTGLMEALDRAGDPANALLYARKHRELLRNELNITLPVEVKAAERRVREGCVAESIPGNVGGRPPNQERPAIDADPDDTVPVVSPAESVEHESVTAATVTRYVGSNRPLVVLVAVAVIVLVVTGAALIMPRVGGVNIDPNHVVVSVFRNATGDPSLDLLGERAAHWVTQGIQQASIPVTPWDAAYMAWEYVQAVRPDSVALNPLQALAEETGAGTVVSGTIYTLEDNCLEIVVSVTDAKRQRLIGTLVPVSGSADSATALIGELRQRIVGYMAMRSDEQRAAPFELAGDPPTYEAYRELRTGMGYFVRAEMAPAEPHFRRAVELDSTFAEALFFLAITNWNMGKYLALDSVLNAAQRHEHRYTPYYRAQFGYVRALLDNDLERARLSARRAAEMAPGARASFAFAATCYWTNRPAETIRELIALDPERGAMRGWVGYSGFLTEALFMVGDHESELNAARRARVLYPENLHWALSREALALAAMGRLERIGDVLDSAQSIIDLKETSRVVERSRQAPVEVVEVLLKHGHATTAREILELAIDRFERRPQRIAASHHHRLWYGRALHLASRNDDARHVLDALVAEFPENVPARGTRAFIAAAGGDSSQARQDARWLAELDRPFLFGEHTYWRGVIAGWLGDREGAVTLLQSAHEQGRRYHWYDMVSTELNPLRGYPAFEEWLRPKG